MNLDKLFDLSPARLNSMPDSIMVCLGIDTHVHGRTPQDGRSQMVMRLCAGEFEAIIDIANVPDVTTGADCYARRRMLESLVPAGQTLKVYTAPLINDKTDPEMLMAAWDKPNPDIACVKIFWEGVSNAYGQFITSAEAIEHIIRSTTAGLRYQREPLRISIHAECVKNTYTGEGLDIAEREWWCIENQVALMLGMNPKGVYIIRHVSDWRTLEWIAYVWSKGYKVYGEVSPQYLIQVADDIFKNDDGHAELQCDCLYWPRPKDPRSRKALQEIVIECPPWLIYGSDLALHLHDPMQAGGVKINNMGKAVGGLTFMPAAAKSILIDFCLSRGKPENLRKLMVEHPSKAYGIKLAGTEVEYIRKDWMVPDYTFGTHVDVNARYTKRPVCSINFLRGKTMHWQRAVPQ